MSNAALNWWVDLKIDPTAKHVGMVMANRAKDHDLIYKEKLADLERETSRDKSTIIWCLHYLVETGLLEVVPGEDKRCSWYRIRLNAIPKADVPKLRRTVRHNKNRSYPATQLGCTVQPNPPHTPPILKNTKKPEKTIPRDARHSGFIGFLKSEHSEIVLQPADFKCLKTLLLASKESPLYSLENLKAYWRRFMASKNKFHQQQGPSLRFFCVNIVQFIGNGHGLKADAIPPCPRPELTPEFLAECERDIARMKGQP